LREFGKRTFAETGLKSIAVPTPVGMIGKDAFRLCESRASVMFEAHSVLRDNTEGAFGWTRWSIQPLQRVKSVMIEAFVGTIGEGDFRECTLLETMAFEAGSVLREVGDNMFVESRLTIIVISADVGVIDKATFSEGKLLASVRQGIHSSRSHETPWCTRIPVGMYHHDQLRLPYI
jgi:hypothetical protein